MLLLADFLHPMGVAHENPPMTEKVKVISEGFSK
jgi:hypothetical protein